jgi:hypothetical protein
MHYYLAVEVEQFMKTRGEYPAGSRKFETGAAASVPFLIQMLLCGCVVQHQEFCFASVDPGRIEARIA